MRNQWVTAYPSFFRFGGAIHGLIASQEEYTFSDPKNSMAPQFGENSQNLVTPLPNPLACSLTQLSKRGCTPPYYLISPLNLAKKPLTDPPYYLNNLLTNPPFLSFDQSNIGAQNIGQMS